MKRVTCKVEVVDGRVWVRLHSSAEPGIARIHELLRWIVEQINFQNYESTCDDDGNLTSLLLGAAASPRTEDMTTDALIEEVKTRSLAVNVAGLLAIAREAGIRREHLEQTAAIAHKINQAGHDNTSLHYAFDLIGILERIANVSFVLDYPAIQHRAGPGVVALLKEATRAYLFGLTRACVASCRALLEAALRERVSPSDLLVKRDNTKAGELARLVNTAFEQGHLSRRLQDQAHSIRRAGNSALHAAPPNDEAAWRALKDTRAVIVALYP